MRLLWHRSQIPAGDAGRILRNFLQRSPCHNLAASFSSAWPHVDHVVGIADYGKVVLNDDNGCAFVQKSLKNADQCLYVQGMQAYGRLVEDKHGIILRFSDFACQLQALCLSA